MSRCAIYVRLSTVVFFFFKQKTAYEMRISDWSSDVCSSDLDAVLPTQELADLLVGTGEELLGEFAHLDSCDVVDRLLDAADDRRVAHQNTFDEVARLLRLAQDQADRKSTRLNSSH